MITASSQVLVYPETAPTNYKQLEGSNTHSDQFSGLLRSTGMSAATSRQKQFLRRLGCTDLKKLSKEEASALIQELLEKEKTYGKTFPCPYCKAKFGPRPKRKTKCASCGNPIIHLSGKFYTQGGADELNQKDWLKEAAKERKEMIREDWRDERKFRRDFDDTLFVGYLINAGGDCIHARSHDGILILLEDAIQSPELLPPYKECRHDNCECEARLVAAGEVPNGTKVGGSGNMDVVQIRGGRTRNVRLVEASDNRRTGCISLVVIAVVVALLKSVF